MKRMKEAGQALVISALALVALLAALGLAIDMGMLRYDKRLQQTAADSAALAGATNLINPSDGAGSTGLVSGAQNASASNGYTDNNGGSACPSTTAGLPSNLAVGTVAVTVCNPPIYGPHAGDSNYVEAYVSVGQPTFFTKVLGINSETVVTRAVATAQSGYSLGGGCLWALLPPTSGIEGLDLNGNDTLNAPTCGISDNGNFNTDGNALTVNAGTFGIAGATNENGTKSSDVVCTAPQPSCPEVTSGYSDPMTGQLTAPTPSSSPYTASINGGTVSCSPSSICTAITNSTGTVTGYALSPGTYCSILINGTNVTFSPGLFIIEGTNGGCSTSNLNVQGNPTITGTGVTFYFTGSSTINVTGTPTFNLTAPGTSPVNNAISGVLMWQDPNDTNTGTKGTTGPQLGGNSGSQFNGIIYMPNDQLTFFGNNGSTFSVAVVVVGSVALSGDPTVNFQGTSALPTGVTGGVTPALVE